MGLLSADASPILVNLRSILLSSNQLEAGLVARWRRLANQPADLAYKAAGAVDARATALAAATNTNNSTT